MAFSKTTGGMILVVIIPTRETKEYVMKQYVNQNAAKLEVL
jgi:hypothetical protein